MNVKGFTLEGLGERCGERNKGNGPGKRAVRDRQTDILVPCWWAQLGLLWKRKGSQCGLDAHGTTPVGAEVGGRSRRQTTRGVWAVQSGTQAPALHDLDQTANVSRRQRSTEQAAIA